MPELPEVETIRRGIDRHLRGHRIVSVEGGGGRLVRNNPQGMVDLHAHLTNSQVTAVERRGKFMWVEFDEADSALVIHLGMSGHVRILEGSSDELGRHEHVGLTMDEGQKVSFIDPRMFGHLTISRLVEDVTGRLVPEVARSIAPDPLEDTPVELWTTPMLRTRRFIKTVLLDQTVISGIGNIYADEALFRAGINGLVRSDTMSPATATNVVEAARDVMTEAVAVGGTSFDALYLNTDGDPGYFARSLQVYGREAEPCKRCGHPVERQVINGRSHHFCAECQKLPD